MPKASDLKRGDVIEIQGNWLLTKEIEVHSPSARGAATLYKVRFSNVKTGLKQEESFKGDDMLSAVQLERRQVSLSYIDADDYVFMDDEDFSQHILKQAELEDQLPFLTDDIQGLQILMVEGQVVALELPQTVEMVITETSPAMKAASASARTKPATFGTGLTIQVPEYVEEGSRVRIHTGERRFMGRAD